MVFFKKKPLPLPDTKALTPQDFVEQGGDIPIEETYPQAQQYQQPPSTMQRIQDMGERIDNATQGFSNMIHNPNSMQPIPQQPMTPQTMQRAVAPQQVHHQQPLHQQSISDDVAREAIVEIDARLKNIEAWMFRIQR